MLMELVLCFGLPLLRANEVEMAFVEDVVSDMSDDQHFLKFADYVGDLVENYLDARYDFSPNLWAASHAMLINVDFYSAQPNVYLFVETLLRQQT